MQLQEQPPHPPLQVVPQWQPAHLEVQHDAGDGQDRTQQQPFKLRLVDQPANQGQPQQQPSRGEHHEDGHLGSSSVDDSAQHGNSYKKLQAAKQIVHPLIQMPRQLLYVGKRTFCEPGKTDYVESQELKNIFGEMTKLLLRKATTTPQTVLGEFITNFSKGEHAILQSYVNFSRYALNKVCFVASTIKIFDLDEDKQTRNGQDYIQLLRLVCSDFPKELALQAMRMLREKDHDDVGDLFLLADSYNSRLFMRALAIELLYEQFFLFLDKKSSGHDHLKIAKVIYTSNKPYFQKPPFHILAQMLLNNSQVEGTGVLMVDQDTVDMYSSADEVSVSAIKRQLVRSTLMCRFIDDLIRQFQLMQIRAQEIVKIMNDRPVQVDTSSIVFQSEREKKKKITKK